MFRRIQYPKNGYLSDNNIIFLRAIQTKQSLMKTRRLATGIVNRKIVKRFECHVQITRIIIHYCHVWIPSRPASVAYVMFCDLILQSYRQYLHKNINFVISYKSILLDMFA